MARADTDVARLLEDVVPLTDGMVIPLAGIEDVSVRSFFAWLVGHGAFGRKTTSGRLIHRT